MGIKDIAVGRSDVFRIPVDDVLIKDGWNVRDMSDPANIEHVENLAKSIAEIGQKEPIKVYLEGNKAYVSNGHSRRLAVDIARSKYGAEIKSMICMVEEKTANEADRTFTMIASNSGKPLSPLEMGAVFKRLIGFGWTEKEIAAKAGFSGQRVRDLLQLQASSPEVQQMIKGGQVTATLAQQTIRAHKGDDTAATETLKDAVATAEKAGKKKATAKHVKKPKAKDKPSKAENLLSSLTPVPGGFMVTIDQMVTLRKLLKVK